MASAIPIDFGRLTRELGIDQDKIARTVALLDDGNTVPFITRYRRDQTGGLDEEQIGRIRESVTKLRLLDERKQTILRSIESQHALTDELRELIARADSVKRLEDLYLPYRPKKQTLATKAHEQGLAPLAEEILAQDKAAADLDKRAADFINTDKGIPDAATALLGAGHILAEQFSEDPEVRQKVRKLYRKTGKLASAKARRQPEEESAVSRLPRFPRAAEPGSAASRAGDQSWRAGQGAARASRGRCRRPSRNWALSMLVPAEPCAQRFSDRLRPRCARAADLAELGARGAPRADREGGNARSRSVCPQLAESAAAAAAAGSAGAGRRPGLQERLQVGGAR